jgi:WD40 repeat protein
MTKLSNLTKSFDITDSKLKKLDSKIELINIHAVINENEDLDSVNNLASTVLNGPRKSWRLLHSYSGHLDSIECLSSNSNILVSGSADTSLRIWDLEFKNVPKVLGSHSGLSLTNGRVGPRC